MMKVRVKTKGFRLLLYLPAALLFSRWGVSAALYVAGKYVRVPETEKKALAERIKTCVKHFKGLTLVEVRTGAGEEILVKL